MVKFRELTADERTRDLYERREKARRDQDMYERWAIKQSMFGVARNMIADEEPIDKIMKYTGLSFQEIESLDDESLRFNQKSD